MQAHNRIDPYRHRLGYQFYSLVSSNSFYPFLCFLTYLFNLYFQRAFYNLFPTSVLGACVTEVPTIQFPPHSAGATNSAIVDGPLPCWRCYPDC